MPCVANGRIAKPGDVDVWTFDGVKGQAIEFDLRAASLGSPLDAVLTILNAAGQEVISRDDRSATDADPLLPIRRADRRPLHGSRRRTFAESRRGRNSPIDCMSARPAHPSLGSDAAERRR